MRNANRMLVTLAVLLGVSGVGVSGVCAQDWPQWRGPNRDNKVVGFTPPQTWPKELTKKWSVTVGIGEASPLLVGDKLYVFGRQGGDEVALCLDAASGKEVWRDKYPAAAITNAASRYPGPRSTPAVGEGKVCTLGVHGVVSCLDAADGKVLWRKQTKPPDYYTSTSPIIVEGKCVVFGDGLTAYDLATGEVKWQRPAGTPYGSPVLMTAGGVKQVVTPAAGGLLVGVGLADGKLLWQMKVGGPEYQSSFSTPIVDGQTVIYSVPGGGGKFGKGKGKGGGASGTVALRIDGKGDKFTVTEVWKNPLSAAGYHTPLLKDGLLFGVTGARNVFCLDAKTGEERWIDKTTQRGQCGSILDVGPVLLSLTSDERLVVFQPSPKEYVEVTRYPMPESWCVPIVAGNRIFVKDRAGSLTLWTIE